MQTRNTIQRHLVLEAVGQLHHPTAEEVYNAISTAHPHISKGTVYRNLNLLVDTGCLRKVLVPDGADRFDVTLEEHYHIRCKVCGYIADADIPYQQNLLEMVEDDQGFLIEEHDIMFKGVCPHCRERCAS